MFLSYITFHLIRGTILEGHSIVANYSPNFHMHPPITTGFHGHETPVGSTGVWERELKRILLPQAPFITVRHLTVSKIADESFVSLWSPRHFCSEREIFSTTFLLLLSHISKELADKLSSISEAPQRAAGLNFFPRLWAACNTGGGWDCRDHPDDTKTAHWCWTLGVPLQLRHCGLSTSHSRGRRCADACPGMVLA